MKKFLFIFSISFLFTPTYILASTYSDSDVPLIFPRSSWETEADLLYILDWVPEEKNSETLKDVNPNGNETIPDYAPIERIIIHDTGCCNKEYDDSKQVIRSIYKNHAIQRGWGDIGYHYIIDKSGNIYEARFGGNGVRGAHLYDGKQCRNFNVGTVGISVLGDYQNIEMPKPAVDSLAQLVGWLSATNGIEPNQMEKTSLIWTNPKIANNCSSEYGAFSSSFTGAVVLGHNEIESANSDPGTLNMTQLRQDAKKWKDKYSAYSYTVDGDIISIKNGLKSKDTSNSENIVKINSTQAWLFPDISKINLPEGTLIKARSRPEIFIIEKGKKRYITSYQIFKQNGYSLSDVKTLGDRELLEYQIGDPLIHKDGSILESIENKKMYLVKDGEKRYIVSDKAFKNNKLNKKNIIKVSDKELEYYHDGGIVALPDGSIITDIKRKDFFLVADGGKKRFSNQNVFIANKFNNKKWITLNKKDLDIYPDKGYVLYPEGTLIKEDLKSEIYVVKKNKLEWIPTYDEFKKLGYSMKKVISLQSVEFSKYKNYIAILIAPKITSLEDIKKPMEVVAVKNNTPITATIIYTPSTQTEKNIRIAISEIQKSDAVKISANEEFNLITTDGSKTKYNAGESTSIVWSQTGDVKLKPSNKDTIFEILTYKDNNWNGTQNFNKFRGFLEIAYSKKSNKTYIINELPFEEYLLGIAEAVNSDPKEYQRALAVSSRSYSLFHLMNGGKRGTDEIFHLNNTSSDQVYRGYSFELYSPNLAMAVKDTVGEIIKYNGKVARTVYSSDSGGITKNACKLWRGIFCEKEYDYLSGGIYDPKGTKRRDATEISKSHGVGMSAVGGRRLAELGKNYKEILQYYYKGISVENIK
ncbi:MAG: N-acetylmuramoyl-L-alanine amidase [Patescibacteria group bacterium]